VGCLCSVIGVCSTVCAPADNITILVVGINSGVIYSVWANLSIMGIKIIRRPRSAKRMTDVVRNEVRRGLNDLAGVVKIRLKTDVKDWDEQPSFIVKVVVSDNHWVLEARVNSRQRIGKIYKWVDEGVGEYGGKAKLPPIVAKKRNKTGMGFNVPHQPKTLPVPPVPGIPAGGPQTFVRTRQVRHPGIYPRRFTETLKDWLKSKQPGAFRSVIEAAVKRAVRRR
jgi:hypothetical protein